MYTIHTLTCTCMCTQCIYMYIQCTRLCMLYTHNIQLGGNEVEAIGQKAQSHYVILTLNSTHYYTTLVLCNHTSIYTYNTPSTSLLIHVHRGGYTKSVTHINPVSTSHTHSHLSVRDINSQIDVPEAAAAYPTNEPIFPANLKLLGAPAPAACC